MPQANLTDIQEVTITIPNGEEIGYVVVTHNLQDQEGNHLTPDTIIPEWTDFTGNGLAAKMGAFTTVRSTPEDGTYQLGISAGENTSGDDWVFTVRVTSEYKHSIQSDDHTA